ncbi:MAG: hypothetical protein ABSG41_07215 [Bryobacteraceae bacterium]|jgi:hypothetical protein
MRRAMPAGFLLASARFADWGHPPNGLPWAAVTGVEAGPAKASNEIQ